MAVSGSINFSQSATQLVSDARSLLGIQADEEPLEAHELTRGLNALTMMLKTWQAAGVMTHTLTEGSFALAENDTSVTFGSGMDVTTVPFDIDDVRITRNSTDLPMARLTRQEYYAIPNKTSTGYPTQFYYDRQRETGTLYIWPAADSTAGAIKFTYRRVINDMDAAANTLDLPPEYHEAVVYNLAVRLASHYGVSGSPDYQNVRLIADQTYMAISGFDVAEGKASISILPGDQRFSR